MAEVLKKKKVEEGEQNTLLTDQDLKSDEASVVRPASSKRLEEKDAGIQEYISQHEGFSGIIKQRFSDFMVNEVDLDGNVIHLTDMSPPQCDQDIKEEATPANDVFSDEQLQQLKELSESKDTSASVIIKVNEDKEERSRVHKGIRKLFTNLDSLTEDDASGSKVIKIIVANHKNCKDKRFLRNNWPSSRPQYCHFVLYKENKDTMEAVNVLAQLTKLRAGNFLYAGTKDKRAKTSQNISIHKVTATRLHALNKILKGIRLGNFKYCQNSLKLGDHCGNHFNIVIRNVTGSDSQIEQALSSLSSKGFINYYGMQRFGTWNIPTHHIGRAILQEKWQEAVDLILQPKEGSNPNMIEAGKIWLETRDAKKALAALGQQYGPEKQLLQGLSSQGNKNYVNAMTSIPRYSRQMYTHAYQSYVWNTITSRRIREMGLKPVPGDLVRKDKNDKDSFHILSEEDLDQYSITDVILPLPGHSIQLPTNQVKDWYTEMLTTDALSLGHFKHKVRDYCLAGEQRNIMVLPSNLKWSVCHYDDVTLPLTLSDADILDGKALSEPAKEGAYKALLLEFTLPPSAYATMALREIFKQDTSAAHQTSLNTA